MTLANTNKEHNFVSVTRRVVINSSVWVMIAALVAAYFITERIVNPLRKMTAATKSFAAGDFSTRVDVDKHNTEIAELAKAFNNMAESLESLEKMRNSFLANISHDLRTPMTTISGFIDGINSGAIPPEKHEYYLGVISGEVHRLSRLVTQLLDVSRLESGERKFNYTDFDIAEVARLILISFNGVPLDLSEAVPDTTIVYGPSPSVIVSSYGAPVEHDNAAIETDSSIIIFTNKSFIPVVLHRLRFSDTRQK
jgi:signal transduction histidine kinase